MRKAKSNIETSRLLTDEEARQVQAAFALAGFTRASFSRAAAVSYSTLSKAVRQTRTPTPAVARALEELLESTRWPHP